MAEEEVTTEEAAPPPEPERRYGALLTSALGQDVVHTHVAEYHDLVKAIRDDGFALCLDVTAVDYLTNPNRALPEGIERQRFELVVNLLSMSSRSRLRVRCQVPAHDLTVPTITDLFAGADAPEREVYDMFGIIFDGHPDLNRILMPEDWEGHPLRKDYAVGRIPVQFKAAPGHR